MTKGLFLLLLIVFGFVGPLGGRRHHHHRNCDWD